MRLRGLHILAGALVTITIALSLRFYLPTDSITRTQFILNVQERIESDLNIQESEIEPVLNDLREGSGKKFSTLLRKTRYPYFVFKNKRLFFWSDNKIVPKYSELNTDQRYSFLASERGMFIVQSWKIEEYIEVVSIVPLFTNSLVENAYLGPEFNTRFFRNTDIDILQAGSAGETVFPVQIFGEALFAMQIAPEIFTQDVSIRNLTSALMMVGLLFMLLFLYIMVKRQTRKYRYYRGFLILLFGLILLRGFSLLTGFPSEYSNIPLFDSVNFASSQINPTLGDFFINVILVLVSTVYIYQTYYKMYWFRWLLSKPIAVKRAIAVLLMFVGLLLITLQYLVFQSIYLNSQISLDITRLLSFDLLRVTAYTIFILNATIFFLIYHVIFRIVNRLVKEKLFLYMALALVGILYLPITMTNPVPFWSVFILNSIYFSLLLTLNLPRTLIQFRYNAYVYFFISALICSLIGSIAIERYEGDENFKSQSRFLNQFLVENDQPAEFILSQKILEIQSDVFISRQLYNPFFSKDIIGEKIRRVYLSGYLDKYNIEVSVYAANGQPVGETSTKGGYFEIRREFTGDQYATEHPRIFFVNRSGVDVTKRYLVFIPMELRNVSIGYILLDLELKKLLPNTVFPELLVDSKYMDQLVNNKDYSYAVFSDDELIYNVGAFNYAVDFSENYLESLPQQEYGILLDGWRHIAGEDADNRLIVVSTSYNRLDKVVSNFSFLFLLIVFLILLFIGLYVLFASYSRINMNYSAKIQLNLNLAFFTPLFIVSFIILSLITTSLRNEIDADHTNAAEIVGDNIISRLDQYMRDQVDAETFSAEISQIAKVAGIDISIFNKVGQLMVSSQPLIYQYGILSNRINPEAMIEISDNGRNSVILSEQVGSLTYNNTYVVLKSFETGNIMAILSVPYFDSGSLLEKEQISVLTTIVNIFSLVFIIFLGISYFVSKWLTLPLNFITQRIKRTTLSDTDPIEWHSDDEIGLLVSEYNRMLVNLEASKRALARSEKESAWREMAKQVAHEIKNPLTPMKLTLQQLQRTITEKSDNGSKGIQRPINNLLHQIDTLSDIATSFSSFAKMPIPENERFDLVSCLRKTLGIYKNSKEASIHYTENISEVSVIGDEQLTGRIISNIIINSLQSAFEERDLEIDVSIDISEDGNKVVISIADNGVGIPEEAHSKVFVPNFSTKDTGSGIGLAIAKHGIEHAGGTIWFDSSPEGTIFYIELPVSL